MKVFTCADNRINWVDYYKAFSIFLIVLGHAILNNEQLVQFLFLFHVPLFFFISGYLEKTEKCNAKQYLKKIGYALIIPYFLWNVICVIFHFPVTIKGVCAVVVGLSLWNGASWFLGVLVFLKLIALTLRNNKYIIATLIFLGLLALFILNKRTPYYANLTFMYMPFYFVGMYGKVGINKLVRIMDNRVVLNIGMSVIGIILLLFCFNYTDIPHTCAVVDYTDKFYLYWITGFLGSFSMLFLCLFFNDKPSGLIQAISVSTLFIMCSHYEIICRGTGYITDHYRDIYSIVFVILYFAVQCVCLPIVLRWLPVLAGRKE